MKKNNWCKWCARGSRHVFFLSLYTGSQLIRVRWPGKDMDRWKRSIQIDDYYYQWKIEAYCYQLKIEDYWHKSKVEKYQGAEELPESFWPSLGLTPSAHKVVCSCTHQVPCIFKVQNLGKSKSQRWLAFQLCATSCRQEHKESVGEYEAPMGLSRC